MSERQSTLTQRPVNDWRSLDSLWVAALGIQFVVLGAWAVPALIRALGRGGAVETVEWAIYMSFLVVFPPMVLLIGWVVPRWIGDTHSGVLRRALVVITAAEFGVYVVTRATPALILAAVAASMCAGYLASRRTGRRSHSFMLIAVVTGVAAWMAAGALVSWENAVRWIFGSPVRALVLAASSFIVAAALIKWRDGNAVTRRRMTWQDWIALLVLVVFSFRTFPMVEHYHWGFFIGPIEQVRQGGALLWDTPSQYGLMSMLIPFILPGDAWQSFWFYQAVVCAVVAAVMYFGLRRLWPEQWGLAASFLITFTTLFFRPRSATLLLPAQMTPAAGPVRFIWCFVMLAFLARYCEDGRRANGRAFITGGTVIWILALLWSAETAIYVTAMWFPAFLIHVLQTAPESPRAGSKSRSRFALFLALPVVAAIGAGVAVAVMYFAIVGFMPDLRGYFDYVLLYSRGGFGALPIDRTGSVWYLIISFLIVSTILVLHSLRSVRDPRIVVWAGAWGGIWALASYFTGRSHPVNLLTLVPLLLFSIAVSLRMRPFEYSPHARSIAIAVVIPLFAMPVALTAGHASFVAHVTTPQLAPSRFTEQVPLMPSDLQALLVSAGATPDDSFVMLDDGRLMLPAWRSASGDSGGAAARFVSDRSWLPKPFEIIGSLPASRRRQYLERNTRVFPEAGWLVQDRKHRARGGEDVLAFLRSIRREERRAGNANWTVTLFTSASQPAAPASRSR